MLSPFAEKLYGEGPVPVAAFNSETPEPYGLKAEDPYEPILGPGWLLIVKAAFGTTKLFIGKIQNPYASSQLASFVDHSIMMAEALGDLNPNDGEQAKQIALNFLLKTTFTEDTALLLKGVARENIQNQKVADLVELLIDWAFSILNILLDPSVTDKGAAIESFFISRLETGDAVALIDLILSVVIKDTQQREIIVLLIVQALKGILSGDEMEKLETVISERLAA
jgi:hypothetical protein